MNIRRLIGLLCLTIALTMIPGGVKAKESDEVLPDSSDFVKTSLMISTPADIIYSSLGHCAIRMECPSENLDYCFSLETDVRPQDYVRFFQGSTEAAVRAIPTESYIEEFQSQGRGITQYELNLNWKEKQLLWKNLDEEMMKPPHLKFNFLNTNCVMMVIIMIQNALIDEQINYVKLPSYATCDNGNGLRQLTTDTPWYQFIYITLSGSICDDSFALEYRLTPLSLPEVYSGAQIEGNDGVRPLLKGQPNIITKQTYYSKACPITPRIMFSLLLTIIIIITIGEWRWGWKQAPRLTDFILLTVQTLTGLLLTYTSLVSNLFAARWNWYLIPCNLLPLLILLIWGKSRSFGNVYLIYTIVLIAFILATPLSSQLDIDHQLVATMFTVRTMSKYLQFRKVQKTLSNAGNGKM